jgi:stress response protein SCP2
MSKIFVVSINCDNVAFEGDGCDEQIAVNLQQIAEHVATGSTQGTVRDYNGNTVGKYFFAEL